MADSPVLRWSAYEHDHIERDSDWYWALGIVAISIAITSVLLHNILFGVLVILGALALALLSRTPLALAQFELSDKGVRVNDTLHTYEEVVSFWVDDEHHERPMLLIDTTKFLAPNLIIPIEHIDPVEVRAFLAERCAEVKMKEPLGHRILELLGV